MLGMEFKSISPPRHFLMSLGDKHNIRPFIRKVYRINAPLIIRANRILEISEEAFLVLKAQVEKKQVEETNHPVIVSGYGSQQVFYFFRRNLSPRIKEKAYRTEIHVRNVPNTYGLQYADNVNTDIIDEVVANLSKIGITEYFEPFYDFLVELIGNATEHGIKDSNFNWWFKYYIENRSIKFVFVDMGIGIIQSYKDSKIPLKYYFINNKNILSDSMNGILGSSTKKSNRGRGMPFIKQIVEKGYISDFLLITNNVSVKYINGKFVYLRNKEFIGTYFSWTITKENFELWMNSR